MRLGIAGIGKIAGDYIELICTGRVPGVVLTALSSRNAEHLRQVQSRWPVLAKAALYTDYGEMLHSGKLDAVLICTPHAQHPAMALEALECGLPVLLEKPVGIDRTALAAEDLSVYFANDVSLIMRHVFDPAFLQRNRAMLDLDGLNLSLKGDLPPEGDAAEIRIKSDYPLPIPVGRAIALVLSVSLSRVRRMQETGEIQFEGDLRKTKTGFGFSFILSKGWFRTI